MKNFFGIALIALTSTSAFAMKTDDPFLVYTQMDQLEWRDSEEDRLIVAEAQGWLGHDFDKLWWKAEFESVDDTTEEAELQLLYSRTISTYFNAQIGWRRDIKPGPANDWLAVGIQGLAPFFFETDVALFVNDKGQSNLRIMAEYEIMITQQWVLVPELEVNAFGKTDNAAEQGSGLADAEIGLRLHYFFNRQFSAYAGVNWSHKFGKTADFVEAEGDDIEDTSAVAGFSFWF